MTAPDPRLGEIEAAEALVHVKCADCAKCRIAEEDCWCPECEYWGCEQGPDCEDDPKPADVAYLLAELRKAREALAEAGAKALDEAANELARLPYVKPGAPGREEYEMVLAVRRGMADAWLKNRAKDIRAAATGGGE